MISKSNVWILTKKKKRNENHTKKRENVRQCAFILRTNFCMPTRRALEFYFTHSDLSLSSAKTNLRSFVVHLQEPKSFIHDHCAFLFVCNFEV